MFSLYRNVHCAICNKASLEKLICLNLGPFGRFNWQQNFNSFSFAVLFDISGNGKDHVGFVSCQSGELYDPFYKKCRNVRCGQEGTCVNKQLIWTSNASFLPILWLLGMEFRQGRCIDTRVIFPTTTTTTIKTTFVDNDLETTEPEDTTTIPIPLESTPKGNSITPKGDSRVIVASVDQTTRFAFTVTTTTTSTTTQTTTTTTNAKPSTTTSTTTSPVTER